jgi:hypothetical protein
MKQKMLHEQSTILATPFTKMSKRQAKSAGGGI